jgi:hypothetical protein
VRSFLERQGLFVNGYVMKKLHDDLQSAYKKKVNSFYFNSKDTNLIEEIISRLDENHPVEIGFNYMVGTNGHAVVAIGYQDDRDKTKLFCIDPSYPMDECQIWNNVLEIDKTSKAKYNCLNYKDSFKVDVDEILYFLKK